MMTIPKEFVEKCVKDERREHGEVDTGSYINHTKSRHVTSIIYETTTDGLNDIQNSQEKYIHVKRVPCCEK